MRAYTKVLYKYTYLVRRQPSIVSVAITKATQKFGFF